ncbi:MAG TPA: DUF4149 domain-containing protein [Povalibacter sp.]|uniref:DUF4149 domain-containing protein n=1 Tax=Povalibacter sp. TaxID=1962978 RepID=UPI002B926E1F|nr:DUF4149 domain-containing protein [Povalibacter sp.]HMN47095.1 DUF4149 domain-containing protein [Povalibacter sp.]
MARVASILIAFWAGSLWTVCGIVAPSLFAVLDDRRLAGQLAARFFLIETWIGVAVGALLLGLSFSGKLVLPARAFVLMAALLPLASHLLLGPLMERARLAGDMTRFGVLHGIAGACFLVACLSMIVVVWKFSRPAG